MQKGIAVISRPTESMQCLPLFAGDFMELSRFHNVEHGSIRLGSAGLGARNVVRLDGTCDKCNNPRITAALEVDPGRSRHKGSCRHATHAYTFRLAPSSACPAAA